MHLYSLTVPDVSNPPAATTISTYTQLESGKLIQRNRDKIVTTRRRLLRVVAARKIKWTKQLTGWKTKEAELGKSLRLDAWACYTRVAQEY